MSLLLIIQIPNFTCKVHDFKITYLLCSWMVVFILTLFCSLTIWFCLFKISVKCYPNIIYSLAFIHWGSDWSWLYCVKNDKLWLTRSSLRSPTYHYNHMYFYLHVGQSKSMDIHIVMWHFYLFCTIHIYWNTFQISLSAFQLLCLFVLSN